LEEELCLEELLGEPVYNTRGARVCGVSFVDSLPGWCVNATLGTLGYEHGVGCVYQRDPACFVTGDINVTVLAILLLIIAILTAVVGGIIGYTLNISKRE